MKLFAAARTNCALKICFSVSGNTGFPLANGSPFTVGFTFERNNVPDGRALLQRGRLVAGPFLCACKASSPVKTALGQWPVVGIQRPGER